MNVPLPFAVTDLKIDQRGKSIPSVSARDLVSTRTASPNTVGLPRHSGEITRCQIFPWIFTSKPGLFTSVEVIRELRSSLCGAKFVFHRVTSVTSMKHGLQHVASCTDTVPTREPNKLGDYIQGNSLLMSDFHRCGRLFPHMTVAEGWIKGSGRIRKNTGVCLCVCVCMKEI